MAAFSSSTPSLKSFLNAGIPAYSSLPPVETKGNLIYISSDSTVYVSDGINWRPIGGGQVNIPSYPTNPPIQQAGNVIYNTTTKILYYSNGTTWVPIIQDLTSVLTQGNTTGGKNLLITNGSVVHAVGQELLMVADGNIALGLAPSNFISFALRYVAPKSTIVITDGNFSATQVNLTNASAACLLVTKNSTVPVTPKSATATAYFDGDVVVTGVLDPAYLLLQQQATDPATTVGYGTLYAKGDDIYFRKPNGIIELLSSGGGLPTLMQVLTAGNYTGGDINFNGGGKIRGSAQNLQLVSDHNITAQLNNTVSYGFSYRQQGVIGTLVITSGAINANTVNLANVPTTCLLVTPNSTVPVTPKSATAIAYFDGDVVVTGALDPSYLLLQQQVTDPVATTGYGSLYTKGNDAYFRKPDGNIEQLTGNGAVPTLEKVLASGNNTGAYDINFTNGGRLIGVTNDLDLFSYHNVKFYLNNTETTGMTYRQQGLIGILVITSGAVNSNIVSVANASSSNLVVTNNITIPATPISGNAIAYFDGDVVVTGVLDPKYLLLQEQATDPAATAAYGSLYAKADTDLYFRKSSGVIVQLSGDGAVPTLSKVLVSGNTTGSTDIVFTSGGRLLKE